MNTLLRKTGTSVMLASIMVLAGFVMLASAPTTAEDLSVDDKYGLGETGPRLDKGLEGLMMSSAGPFEVYVILTETTSANYILEANGHDPILAKQFEGIPTIQLMELDSKIIWALDECPGVVKIMAFERPMIEPADLDLAKEDVAPTAMPAVDDMFVDFVHGATESWDLGFTGNGVVIADIDTGFDMAHPDLQGQQARYESGTYEGWPMAYDDYGALRWSKGTVGGWLSDTSLEVQAKGKKMTSLWFDGTQYSIKGLTDSDNNLVRSKSGIYHLGYHPDPHLEALYGAPVAVLVVDSTTAGVYDTVYVDITHDFDFSNDKPCTKGDEIAYFDYYNATSGVADYSSWDAGDGFADLSGGMIYWISDGKNVYPASNWTYGATYTGDAGDAVAFMGEFYYGESHGTMTSSAALAASRSMGGVLGGMAYGAKLMCIPFTGSVVNAWMFAQFGVDGVVGTGDEADICTNSYGWSDLAIDAGYNTVDMAAYAVSSSGPTMWFWSTGNGGPGYGTCTSVCDPASVGVGAGTTMQYRYNVGYEAMPADNTWGDVVPFSNSGPSRTGKLLSEIIASGAYSLEPGPLNSYYPLGVMMGSTAVGDGSAHWQYGSGTSHACPTVAGAAALGFHAYFEANGEFPDKHLAKAALTASADDMHYDVFKQASGWLNASTFCKFMSEQGSTVSIAQGTDYPSSALYPGDVYGTEYEMFPNFMVPGADDIELVTTANHGDEEVTVSISSKLLIWQEGDQFDVTMKGPNDKYIDITDMIPADTDLMKVTMFCPMTVFDPDLNSEEDLDYWLELHDWVDLNGNGQLEASVKAPMVWELFRFTIDGSACNINQVMLKDPLERMTDGIILRIRPSIPAVSTVFTVQIDYYQLEEFPWVEFREAGSDDEFVPGLELDIPAGGEVSWEAKVSVPDDACIGTYGAGIYIEDGSRVQCMPVVINVPATEYEFEFGGESYFNTPYNNDIVGVADRWWRFEVGDWRMYWCLPDEDLAVPSPDAYAMAGVEWDEDELTTDINVHVFGPALADPEDDLTSMFCEHGPGYYEQVLGSSDERYLGDGRFGFYTNTGEAKEVIAGAVGAALESVGGPAPFAVLLRCALMAGDEASETPTGFVKWITVSDMGVDPTQVSISLSDDDGREGTLNAWFEIDTDEEQAVKVTTENPLIKQVYGNEEITQGTLTATFEEDVANAEYTKTLTLTQCSRLVVSTAEVSEAPDLDLGVWHDLDADGVAEMTEPYWISGTSGSNEIVTLNDPEDGQYLVKVLGYIVLGEPCGLFSLTVIYDVGATMTADFDQTSIGDGLYEFEVAYSIPEIEGVYVGAVTFGFEGTGDMFKTWVTFTVTA